LHRITEILKNLENGVPQALARFNDGEMRGIVKVGDTVARGCQKVNHELSTKLTEAIKHKQKNYWIGLPCEHCFPRWAKHANALVSPEYEFLTKAVVNTNRNLQLVWTMLPALFNDKMIYWVSGNDQNLDKLYKELGILVGQKISLPKKDAWSRYADIKDNYRLFSSGSIVVLSCGPMAEVLVKEWFERRPDVTFLDLGSTFDPYTRNVWHNCHKGTSKPCPECN